MGYSRGNHDPEEPIKPPLGGIDPKCVRYGKLATGSLVVRVAHRGGSNGSRPNPYSPWWNTLDAFDRLIEYASPPAKPRWGAWTEDDERYARANSIPARDLYRLVQAVTPAFGPANVVFFAKIERPIAYFAGRSRPIYRYHKGDGYPNTYSSQPPLKQGTVKKAFDQQLPGVEQLYIPGISRGDYPGEPYRHEVLFKSVFQSTLDPVPIESFIEERQRVLRHAR